MIIDVKKYLFVGVREDLDIFFERAQQKGVIEFIPEEGKKQIEAPTTIQTLTSALKILRKQPVCKQNEKREKDEEALRIAHNVVLLKVQIERLREQKRLVQAELALVAPLGDFSIEEIRSLEEKTNRKVQFFCMKSRKRAELQDCEELIYLGTEYDLDYFMTISHESLHFPEMIEMHVENAAPALRIKRKNVEIALHAAEHELKALAIEIDFLEEVLTKELNGFHLTSAKEGVVFPIENSLFAVEAWVPENKIPLLFSIMQGLAVHCEMIVIEEQDRVPTYLENKGSARVGEDLVHIYDTPAASDKDPSLWVLWSFALFFAMIIADAGYGILFLLLGLFLKWKYPQLKARGKRFVKLLLILSTSVIIWGAMSTSYFGVNVLPENPLSKLSIVSFLVEKKADYHLAKCDDVYQKWVKEFPQLAGVHSGREMLDGAVVKEGKHLNYVMLNEFRGNILLELSLLIGVIHISLSLLRYMWRNWASLGWMIFIIGGYLFFPHMLQATSLVHFLGWIDKPLAKEIGLELMYVGIALAMVLALVQKRLKGVTEVMHIVTIFADVLSYLRLYALALAATIMAETFNKIGMEVGLVLGCLVIIAGHSINIILGIQGGIIHGLRLNFIEWYHYSFVGGGRLFRPLHKLKAK